MSWLNKLFRSTQSSEQPMVQSPTQQLRHPGSNRRLPERGHSAATAAATAPAPLSKSGQDLEYFDLSQLESLSFANEMADQLGLEFAASTVDEALDIPAIDELAKFDDSEIFHNIEAIFNVDDDLLLLIDAPVAKKYIALPVERDGNLVTVVCASKDDVRKVRSILQTNHPALKFDFKYQRRELIAQCINSHFLNRDTTIVQAQRAARIKQIVEISKQADPETRRPELILSYDDKIQNEDKSLQNLIAHLLEETHWLRGSDLDINHDVLVSDTKTNATHREIIFAQARIDGELRTIHSHPMSLEQYKRIPHILKQKCNLNSSNTWDPQSGVWKVKLDYKVRQVNLELRINFIPRGEDNGESISIRIQEKENFTLGLDKIGLLPDQLKYIQDEALDLNSGLLPICGRVNTGKNVTLVSIIKAINARHPGKRIITLEDPPEFKLDGIIQIKIMPRINAASANTPRSFRDYLPAILRHNFDVAVVGETRESETANMAVEAARIGHLLLTTIHTDNTTECIDRLRQLGVGNYEIARALKVAIAQRLVRTICSNCERRPITFQEMAAARIPNLNELIAKVNWTIEPVFYVGTGYDKRGNTCRQCNGEGLYGRTGVFEILVVNSTLRELISQNATTDEIRLTAINQGLLRTLWSAGIELALRGETTLEQLKMKIPTLDPVMEGLTPRQTDFDLDDDALKN